jgi:serine/threonine protein phosphatase PrpC
MMLQKTPSRSYPEQAERSPMAAPLRREPRPLYPEQAERSEARPSRTEQAGRSSVAALDRSEPRPLYPEPAGGSAGIPFASAQQKRSYAGVLPEVDHSTISLRTQLRLSYETYAWLRYLCWTGLALIGVLLLLLPGGFPPRAAVLFVQTLPLLGRLLSQHGPAALFSLASLGVQALTWFLLWGLEIALCNALIRYTWRFHRAQSFLAHAWQPSSALDKSTEHNDEEMSARSGAPSSPAIEHAPTAPLVRSLAETPQQSSARQFARPSMSMSRPRLAAQPSGEFFSGWTGAANSTPGVAWDVGLKRKGRPNEDSILTLRGTCNFAETLLPFELHIVADGMGGHANGRLASHLAIRGMLETVVPGLVACNAIESEQIVDILIDGVHWANQVIFQYGQEQGTDLGTTITAVLLLNETAYIINVGDSRTYVYRPAAGLTQITRDHSVVARLVETGAITPDEVYTHPERNKVYRGLGDKTDVTVDWFILPVQSGDLLLLCSDGLWEMVRDPKIAETLGTYASSPALASNALLRAALQAGGSDNVSLLVAKVQS